MACGPGTLCHCDNHRLLCHCTVPVVTFVFVYHTCGGCAWGLPFHVNQNQCRFFLPVLKSQKKKKSEKVKLLSRVWFFVTPWTIDCQVPPSPGFSRQEYWSGLPFPSPSKKSPLTLFFPGLPRVWAKMGMENVPVGKITVGSVGTVVSSPGSALDWEHTRL